MKKASYLPRNVYRHSKKLKNTLSEKIEANYITLSIAKFICD